MEAMFSIGFRAFFLFSALSAWVLPNLWISHYLGQFSFPGELTDDLTWHVHEMIFGFALSLIAGFLLTATANWTGRRPYKGKILIGLLFLWILERLAIYMAPSFLALLLSYPFILSLAYFIGKTIYKNRNFYPIMGILGAFLVSKSFLLWGSYASNEKMILLGKEMGIGIIKLLMMFILLRVLPFFSRKRFSSYSFEFPEWLKKTLLTSLLIQLIDHSWNPYFKLILSILILFQLTFFIYLMRPWKIISEPMLWVLHLGVLWLGIGEVLNSISAFYPEVDFSKTAWHAFMIGGLGNIGIGMMCRVSLGHTGRPISSDWKIILMYILINITAIFRIVIPLFFEDKYLSSMHFISGFWSLAFLIFLVKFTKILMTPRPDGKSS